MRPELTFRRYLFAAAQHDFLLTYIVSFAPHSAR
jgi:hypothetical protein